MLERGVGEDVGVPDRDEIIPSLSAAKGFSKKDSVSRTRLLFSRSSSVSLSLPLLSCPRRHAFTQYVYVRVCSECARVVCFSKGFGFW